MTDGSDNDLAFQAAGGNRAAFAALIERHYDRIFRLAWRWAGSRERAEDIAQDVCVKLASAIGSFRGEAQFSTWVHRIAYTMTIDHLRAHQRMVAVEPSEIVRLVDSGWQSAPDGSGENSELWDAVRSLPPQQRDAVLLVYGEDMSHAEAALVLGCSEKTVSWHIHEAKKRLKLRLEAVG